MVMESQRRQHVHQPLDLLFPTPRPALPQLTAVNGENEQLWNAMMHIHASLRAAHAAHLRQQVAMHAAAVAAALPPPQPVVEQVAAPSPATLFGGLFTPGALGGGWSASCCAVGVGLPALLCFACSSSLPASSLLLPLSQMPTCWRPPAACSSRPP